MPARFSSRLLILACSATKRDGPACMPAIQRYDGPLWQTLRAVDPYGEKAKVAFLSAHLGFRAASSPIEIYDARMTDQVAAAMKAGDLGTRWPRPKTQRKVMPSGEHPGVHIGSLTARGRNPFSDVALVGGHLYSMSCAIWSSCSASVATSSAMRGSTRSMARSGKYAAIFGCGSIAMTGRGADAGHLEPSRGGLHALRHPSARP